MRDYMDSWLTPPKRVTSPTWGPPPPCEQALLALQRRRNFQVSKRSALESLNNNHDDGNDNGKKQNVSISKTTTFARVSGFLVHFLTT